MKGKNDTTRILIFGVEGFLGQQAFLYLKENYPSWQIIGISKREHPYSSFIIDITHKLDVQNFIRKYPSDIIFWYAGKSIPAFSQNNPERAYQINVQPLWDVLDVVDERTRFIYPSSRHVYSSSEHVLQEDSLLALDSVYAQHKFDAEQIVLKNHENTVVTRNFNCVGDNPVLGTFMYDIHRQKNKPVITLHNPNQILDVLSVREAVRAHIHVALLQQLEYRIFNICSGTGISISSIVKQVVGDREFRLVSKTKKVTTPIVGCNRRILSSGFTFEPHLFMSLSPVLD